MHVYQRAFASMIYKFFDKKYTTTHYVDQQLAQELRRPITRKFERHKIYSSYRDNIWGADLAIVQLIIKHRKGVRYLLNVIHVYLKRAWVVPLKDEEGIKINIALQKNLG